jgi:2-oxoglutarate dehydrogenase E1 component
MSSSNVTDNANPAYIEMMLQKFKTDPNSVDASWQQFFQGYELGIDKQETLEATSYVEKEVKIMKLINAYRSRGHLISKTNPIRPRRLHQADLTLDYFGLSEADLEEEFDVGHEIRLGRAKLKDIISHLEDTYCASIGVEYRYSQSSEMRQWLHERMESNANKPNFNKTQKMRILRKLTQGVGFEKFLGVKYVGQKRFSLEGLEAFIPAMNELFNEGSRLGVQEFVMGMAHRGRLNVLANLFEKEYKALFQEFEGHALPDEVGGDGDVKYHMGHSADVVTEDGNPLHVSLAANPSHLEAVNPVVLGRVRAKIEELYENDPNKIVPILVHGDAAISGQGIIYEICNMANLDGYATGGTVHVVLNNQVGFTANYRESRSSLYCTDIAKVLNSPVFHVNADDPEAVVHACTLAIQLRQKFGCDVFIDILGYRRHGHNEGDEPRFTQPLLYNAITKHPTVLDMYIKQLVNGGEIIETEASGIVKTFNSQLQEALDSTRELQDKTIQVNFLKKQWSGIRKATQADFEKSPKTGVKKTTLNKIAKGITDIPDDFNILRKLRKIIDQRRHLYFDSETVDWGIAEHLAFGSLLVEGHPVRISGQDSRRGTFSHRHSYLIDEKDEMEYVPLNSIDKDQAKYKAYNSHLSEYGVLGFEYGYAHTLPSSLTIWEAQFGDFANGAQIIYDQFISSAESKWQRMNGLTCFLPHGYEGQGPEHSSARLERFLSLAAENNMIVANPTTPANLFHLLRRQLKATYRIPLIVMTPKSLLRHPKVVSPVSDLTKGEFKETIDDDSVKNAKDIERLVLCSGKIYYELLEEKEKQGLSNVAIVRIEQFYPTPKDQDSALHKKYGHCKDWYWVQEEPQNMGGWYYMRARLDHLRHDMKFISRKKSASPANGLMKREIAFQEKIIKGAFEGLRSKK